MSESLPFERQSARLAVPEWYEFDYFRRIRRVVTPMWLIGALLSAFGIFIILSCLYLIIVGVVAGESSIGLAAFLGIVEITIISFVIWTFVRDYEQRRKARRITPYGKKFIAWLESDFNPWLQESLAIYIEVEDAEELIVRKEFDHFSYRGVSKIKIFYESNELVVNRGVIVKTLSELD